MEMQLFDYSIKQKVYFWAPNLNRQQIDYNNPSLIISLSAKYERGTDLSLMARVLVTIQAIWNVYWIFICLWSEIL